MTAPLSPSDEGEAGDDRFYLELFHRALGDHDQHAWIIGGRDLNQLKSEVVYTRHGSGADHLRRS